MSLLSFDNIDIKYTISEASSIVAYGKYKKKNICIKYNDSMSYTISPNILIEIEALMNISKCECPHIINLNNIIMMNFDIGFTTKFIENRTLQDYIIKKIPFDFDTIWEQIQMGVAHIHGMGYIHRDIKPHNILIDTKNNCAKIIDFGLAYYICDIGINGNRKIPFKYKVQTKGYQAPEILNELSYSSKIDIWGLGIIYVSYIASINNLDIPLIECVDYIDDIYYKSMLAINPKKRPCILHKYPIINNLDYKLSPPYKPELIDYIMSAHIEWKLCYETIACAITLYCNTSMIIKNEMDMKILAIICLDFSSCSFENQPINESFLCEILSITKELYFRYRIKLLEIINFNYNRQTFYDYMKYMKSQNRALFYRCIHIITRLKVKVHNRFLVMEAKKLVGFYVQSSYPCLNALLNMYK